MSRLVIVSLLIGLSAPAVRAQDEWIKGVSYTTSWEDAIKQVKSTGKMLFIYNGWKREKV